MSIQCAASRSPVPPRPTTHRHSGPLDLAEHVAWYRAKFPGALRRVAPAPKTEAAAAIGRTIPEPDDPEFGQAVDAALAEFRRLS